jgi:hypothetical protein
MGIAVMGIKHISPSTTGNPKEPKIPLLAPDAGWQYSTEIIQATCDILAETVFT